jgi:hypothetical protein
MMRSSHVFGHLAVALAAFQVAGVQMSDAGQVVDLPNPDTAGELACGVGAAVEVRPFVERDLFDMNTVGASQHKPPLAADN